MKLETELATKDAQISSLEARLKALEQLLTGSREPSTLPRPMIPPRTSASLFARAHLVRGHIATRTLRLIARHLPLLVAVALTATAPASLSAQSEIKSQVANDLSYRAGGIPTGPTGTPLGDPTITPQFSNVVETSATAGPISNSATLTTRYPSSAAIILQKASIGHTFSSGVPRYFLGDRITPPLSYTNSAGAAVATPAGFWRAEPIRASEVVINPSGHALADSAGRTIANTGGIIVPALATGVYETFYYSPHAKAVFACQPGQVQLWWRSSLPNGSGDYVLVQETFSVSAATTSAVRTLYWTEKSFNGPRVTIPSGRIVTVNPVFSNVFPATVATEFVAVGSSPPADPNAEPATETRTLWFEKTNGIGELHAYNVSGRILIEYLGALLDDGSHEFLGADIVEVTQAATPTTHIIALGEQIVANPEAPETGDANLIARPISSTSSSSTPYYGSTARPDGTLAYYAERENSIEDRVVFYWLDPLDAAIRPASGLAPGLELQWPKYLQKYLQVWPDNVTDFAHYTVANGGSSADTGTGLKFEGGQIPTLVYQDDLSQNEAAIDAVSQRLLVGLGGDQLNRTLLKFTGANGAVWYVRLMTQAADRPGFLEGDGAAAFTGSAYVGRRIDPPSADYTLAGYIAAGTAYSPSAYKDPFAVGIDAAERGAIIPVNTLAAEHNTLKVWWFKKIAPPSSDFPAIYTPAKIGTYTVSYRNDDPKIVLASNEGSGDLAASPLSGFIYTQNDATKIGYNPNEEHALLLSGRAYALRDDLNVTTGSGFSSLPRVLVEYTDDTDRRPAMAAWQVLREDATHTFVYDTIVPTILNSPMPLPRLPLPVNGPVGTSRNTEVVPDIDLYPIETPFTDTPALYQKFTFKDRKGYDWVYRGPHNDSGTDLPASAPLANTEFNGTTPGYWTSTHLIDSPTVANGVYHGVGQGDASIVTSGLPAFHGNDVPTIQIRLKATSNVGAVLFWANEDGGYGGGRSLTVNYTGAGQWQTLTFQLSTSANWAGKTITSLRFDPTSAANQTFEIDWIRADAHTPALGMQWYYTMSAGFHIPGR
ncbi:MAG: hypothetical protein ABW223_04500, partial [Rariglobus sp.]